MLVVCFSFRPFKLSVLALDIVYLMFARRWLPADTHGRADGAPRRPSMADLIEEYQLANGE